MDSSSLSLKFNLGITDINICSIGISYKRGDICFVVIKKTSGNTSFQESIHCYSQAFPHLPNISNLPHGSSRRRTRTKELRLLGNILFAVGWNLDPECGKLFVDGLGSECELAQCLFSGG